MKTAKQQFLIWDAWIDRFWSYVNYSEDADACWPWTKALTGKQTHRYGSFGVPDSNGKFVTRTTHQVSMELAIGRPLREGEQVLHSCDNPPCCNPRHLRIGTNLDNVRDAKQRGRLRPCRGEKNGRAKLTKDQVLMIRKLFAEAPKKYGMYAKLSRRFGVSLPMIRYIVIGQSWKNSVQT